jgi:hypothetical protein
MGLEELANKNSMKDLRPLAKKYGISLRCAKKMDVLKALPPEGLAELEGKQILLLKKSRITAICPVKLIDNNLFYHPAPLGIV